MYKFGMAEDDSTSEDVSESAKPSTLVKKGTLRTSNMSTPVTKPSAKWQRKIKLLPDSIANMTSGDSHHLVMSEELDPHSKSKTYGKSLHVVSRVKGIGQNNEYIILYQLTTDQVHLLQEILVSQTLVRRTSLFVAWQLHHTSNSSSNYQILLYLPLHGQTKLQPMFVGLSMLSLVNSSSRISKNTMMGKVRQIMNLGIPTIISG